MCRWRFQLLAKWLMILLLSNVNIALPDFTALRANVAHPPSGPRPCHRSNTAFPNSSFGAKRSSMRVMSIDDQLTFSDIRASGLPMRSALRYTGNTQSFR